MVKKITVTSTISPARSLSDPNIMHCLGGAKVQAFKSKYNTYRRSIGRAWCFETVLKGAGTLICDGTYYNITPGETYITTPYCDFEYYPNDDDPWEKLFIEVEGSLIDSLGQAYGLHTKPVYRNPLAHDLIEDLNILLQASSQDEFAQKFPMALHRLCACFKEFKTTPTQQMRDYLDRKTTESFQLDDMADSFFISKNHLVRSFKKMYGITPYKYLLSKRIEQACWAIANTNISLKILASDLQFSDNKHLSSTLKRITGKSPSQWRDANSDL